jgi:hypothetical protein
MKARVHNTRSFLSSSLLGSIIDSLFSRSLSLFLYRTVSSLFYISLYSSLPFKTLSVFSLFLSPTFSTLSLHFPTYLPIYLSLSLFLSLTHSPAHAHTLAHKPSNPRTHPHTHTHPHTLTHPHTPSHTHPRTPHTHTCTLKHTLTRLLVYCIFCLILWPLTLGSLDCSRRVDIGR